MFLCGVLCGVCHVQWCVVCVQVMYSGVLCGVGHVQWCVVLQRSCTVVCYVV